MLRALLRDAGLGDRILTMLYLVDRESLMTLAPVLGVVHSTHANAVDHMRHKMAVELRQWNRAKRSYSTMADYLSHGVFIRRLCPPVTTGRRRALIKLHDMIVRDWVGCSSAEADGALALLVGRSESFVRKVRFFFTNH